MNSETDWRQRHLHTEICGVISQLAFSLKDYTVFVLFDKRESAATQAPPGACSQAQQLFELSANVSIKTQGIS